MAIRERRARGLGALALTTELLHRIRLADATAGIWEAADPQWWWRRPRSSDRYEQRFWFDGDGPVAGVILTDWTDRWSCEALVVPGTSEPSRPVVWARALELTDDLKTPRVEVLARDDDAELLALLRGSGFAPTGEGSGTTWMDAADCPPARPVPDGFRLVDRGAPGGRPHPMRSRNGDEVEKRLRQCSLYDPELDLEMVASNGETAGYALFWPDALTGVGLLEPMRTEDAYQRRGLARVLLAAGLNRLVARGARRLKVGFSTEAARDLYTGAGFRVSEMSENYTRAPGA